MSHVASDFMLVLDGDMMCRCHVFSVLDVQAIRNFMLQMQQHGIICPVIKTMLSDLTLSICSFQRTSQHLSNSLIADFNV